MVKRYIATMPLFDRDSRSLTSVPVDSRVVILEEDHEAKVKELEEEIKYWKDIADNLATVAKATEEQKAIIIKGLEVATEKNQRLQQIVDKETKLWSAKYDRLEQKLRQAVISAYECGHNDTVESCYCDAEERADEIIEEALND